MVEQDANLRDDEQMNDPTVYEQENQNLADEPGQKALVDRLMGQWRAGWRGALPR